MQICFTQNEAELAVFILCEITSDF